MNPETLNLNFNEKILITKALIKCKGNVSKAYKINVPCGFYMTYKTYLYKINFLHKIDVDQIKKKTNHKLKKNVSLE